MKTLRFIFACLLSVCLPLQSWAAMLPAPCHHNSVALVVSTDTAFQAKSVVQSHLTQATHTQTERRTHGVADHTHIHTHKHASSDKQSHSSWDTQTQVDLHHPGWEAVTVVEHSSNHADSHVVGHDNCCKHGGSCCTLAVMLPTALDVLSPSLAQTTLTWDAPLLLAVTPRTFDRPPKPSAV